MASRLTGRRAVALAGLAVAVAAVHGCVVRQVAATLGAAAVPAMPERLQVTTLRAMAAADPVPASRAAPVQARAMARAAPALPAPGASAPQAAASGPETPPSAPVAPDPASAPAAAVAAASAPAVTGPADAASAPEIAAAASAIVDAPVAAADVAASAPPFEWPLGTRLTYDLTGHYRGPIHGDAKVEWVRNGDQYQMNLDVSVGPSLTPFMSRRMTSQGRITAEGLRPAFYDQETRLPFGAPTRASVAIAADGIRLANGQHRPAPHGVQDTASQFVQLAWQFSTQPGLLTPGALITVPLAMPRSVTPMQYDVSDREVLHTRFGAVPVYRLKPRLVPRAGGDLAVEMWIAPQYRYLPIRLVIHQDAETFVDLLVRQVPEEAVAGPSGGSGAR